MINKLRLIICNSLYKVLCLCLLCLCLRVLPVAFIHSFFASFSQANAPSTMLLSDFSLVTPYGSSQSSCGYCKSMAGSHTYGMSAHLMTCKVTRPFPSTNCSCTNDFPGLADSQCLTILPQPRTTKHSLTEDGGGMVPWTILPQLW